MDDAVLDASVLDGSGDELVHLQVADGVATVTLDSPGNRNALSAQLLRELAARLDDALHRDDARVVVLAHTGPAFCAGMDLREAGTPRGDEAVGLLPGVIETLWTAPLPVLVTLAGAVRGGGIGIVAASDVVIAAPAVTFAFPEVRLGVVPAVVSAPVLPRLRPRDAQELFLTGETVDAARAAEIGLVSRVVDDLDGEVDRVVGMLRLGAPGALAATKALLRRGLPSLAAELAELTALSVAHFGGAEGREGVRARAQRRPPSWAPS